jgi:hypothetical protein
MAPKNHSIFLTGMGGMGCFMISFVICVECVGVKYTMLVGIIIEIPFAIGELLLGLEAYFLRDFFPLQLVKIFRRTDKVTILVTITVFVIAKFSCY